MSTRDDGCRHDRRAFLGGATGLGALAALGSARGAEHAAASSSGTAAAPPATREPFWGTHQAGIATVAQRHVYFAAFDLAATRREEVAKLMESWTRAAARMALGETAQPLAEPLRPVAHDQSSAAAAGGYASAPQVPPAVLAADTGEALGLAPARLTLTFGFGTGLFTKDGRDRYALAAQRPEAFVELPRFPGDQLVAEHTGGDLAVQACAEDPQIAFHAVRQLARLAGSVARIRWVQTGFLPHSRARETPRNLMGFKDGTNNPSIADPASMDRFVWVGAEGPAWMRGGSYLVARRIRIALEHWDRMNVVFQEQTIGRRKYSGAPLGRSEEFAPLDLEAMDHDGNPVIPENAHVRLASRATNDGAQILRRPYSYNDGVNFTVERWPPWRQGLEYDAGLFFLAYQRDPRSGFIKIYERMSRFDMLNQFVTHVGGGLFACPGGVEPEEFIGQRLLES